MRLVLLAPLFLGSLLSAGEFPAPAVDQPASANHTATAVFAGGCFWGVEAVFDRLSGVGHTRIEERSQDRFLRPLGSCP